MPEDISILQRYQITPKLRRIVTTHHHILSSGLFSICHPVGKLVHSVGTANSFCSSKISILFADFKNPVLSKLLCLYKTNHYIGLPETINIQ